jgi:hypothetical protein
MDLFYFLLVGFGMTQILVYGFIFDNIRPKHHFFHCPMCVGFWVGVFLCTINPFVSLFNFDVTIANCFCLGCLNSGTAYVLCNLFGDSGIRVERS